MARKVGDSRLVSESCNGVSLDRDLYPTFSVSTQKLQKLMSVVVTLID